MKLTRRLSVLVAACGLVASILPLTAASVFAGSPCTTTCYVNATTGNDANGGASPGDALKTIQVAGNRVSAGGTVHVAKGTYAENVVVATAQTIDGAGQGRTIVIPALSNPNCGGAGGGSLCDGGLVSNVFLVQADNVTISNLTVDGNNPSVTSSVTAGGSDIDARNGIIDNWPLGVFNGFVVHDVTVKNVFLRGIYASSGGTFNFRDNTVTNVQADPSSVAIFNFLGSGVIKGNNVSYANDAISSNWSAGTQFLNNTITHSGGGVHTDNAGSVAGNTPDLISGNKVSSCAPGGYGVYSFVPYLSPTIQNNTISGCTVALAAFGDATTGVTTNFQNNTATGLGAGVAGTVGAYITSDTLGYGPMPVSASLTGNRISKYETGVQIVETAANLTTATVNRNSISGNRTGLTTNAIATIDATCNWWGAANGPSGAGPGSGDTVSPNVTFTPWLRSPNLNAACPSKGGGGGGGGGHGGGGGGHGRGHDR